MMASAQQRIAAMNLALKDGYSIHVIVGENGWSVYRSGEQICGRCESLSEALDAAEAYTRKTLNADDNLARTLGIAS
tara:strand:- start:332 stop:562 length:231 start_codon:yes stop_codon:yes gene_type:complete